MIPGKEEAMGARIENSKIENQRESRETVGLSVFSSRRRLGTSVPVAV